MNSKSSELMDSDEPRVSNNSEKKPEKTKIWAMSIEISKKKRRLSRFIMMESRWSRNDNWKSIMIISRTI